jgi:hypothetical protein
MSMEALLFTGLLVATGGGCGLAVQSVFVFVLTMVCILKARKAKKLKALYILQAKPRVVTTTSFLIE